VTRDLRKSRSLPPRNILPRRKPFSLRSMLVGLLTEFPFAPEMRGDLQKSRSSLLNHIFSTISAIALSSA
jgi:hypothetical protein